MTVYAPPGQPLHAGFRRSVDAHQGHRGFANHDGIVDVDTKVGRLAALGNFAPGAAVIIATRPEKSAPRRQRRWQRLGRPCAVGGVPGFAHSGRGGRRPCRDPARRDPSARRRDAPAGHRDPARLAGRPDLCVRRSRASTMTDCRDRPGAVRPRQTDSIRKCVRHWGWPDPAFSRACRHVRRAAVPAVLAISVWGPEGFSLARLTRGCWAAPTIWASSGTR